MSGKKKRAVFAVAAVGTAVVITFAGAFLGRNVFAAEERVTVTQEKPDALYALTGMEAFQVYKNGIYKDAGCSFILPAGYAPDKSRKGMYVSTRYPVDSSNIYYTVSDSIDTQALREAFLSGKYKEIAERKFKEAYGEEAVITSFETENTEVDGCPACKIRLSFKAGDMTVEQLVYMIAADKTYTITWSQSADDERMDDFEQSAQSVHMIFE